MSFTIKGKIISISEVKNFDNGAKGINYQVQTNEQYNNLYSFEMYKGAEHTQHIDNFIKYNKVDDEVSVEWNVRTSEYQGKFYTNLSAWKVEKESLESNNGVQLQEVEGDGLPF